MPILILSPSAAAGSPAAETSARLLDHFAAGWPGTFVLLALGGAPEDARSRSTWDWFQLPAQEDGWGWEGLSEALVRVAVSRFEIGAVVGVGLESLDLLRRIEGRTTRRILLLLESQPVGDAAALVDAVIGPGPVDAVQPSLDDELSRHVPVEVVVGPESHVPGLLEQLEGHVALADSRRTVIHWRGRPSRWLPELLRQVIRLTDGQVELRILSSEFFDVPRAGLTHTPGEFLFQPEAWRQLAGFAGLVLSAPSRVEIRVRTVSRKRWIHQTVGLANQGVGLYRSLLRSVVGGGR